MLKILQTLCHCPQELLTALTTPPRPLRVPPIASYGISRSVVTLLGLCVTTALEIKQNKNCGWYIRTSRQKQNFT